MGIALQSCCDLLHNVAEFDWLVTLEHRLSHINGELNDIIAIESLCLFIAPLEFRKEFSHELLGFHKGGVSAYYIRIEQSVLNGLLTAGPTSQERFVKTFSGLVERVFFRDHCCTTTEAATATVTEATITIEAATTTTTIEAATTATDRVVPGLLSASKLIRVTALTIRIRLLRRHSHWFGFVVELLTTLSTRI